MPRAAPDGHVRSSPHQHGGKAGPGSPSRLPLVLCSKIPVLPGACGSRELWSSGAGAESGAVLCCHRMDVFFQAPAAPFLTLLACAKQPS